MEDARLDGWLEARNEAGDYRRVEVITGRRRRRDWSTEDKARILAESAEPGANVSEVARRHGVNRGLLTVWRRQAGLTRPRGGVANDAPDGAAMFVPVKIAADAEGLSGQQQDTRPRIAVELRGGRILIDGGIDPRLAAAVVSAALSRS
jgi:transposase